MPVDDGTTSIIPITEDGAPRVRLVVERGAEKEKTIECRRVVTLLGSRSGCKVHLRHRRISPVHVAIVNNGSEVIAVDLVTQNSPLLNGLKMEHEKLSDGDMLEIPPFVFRIDLEEPGRDGHADIHPFLEPTPNLVALEHMTTGRILRSNRDVCVVGRRSGCDIVLSDSRVSRTHCLLFSYFGFPAIFDLLSQNQTFINDEPISYRALKDNDILTIGDTRFRVRLVGSKVTEHASKSRKEVLQPSVTPTPQDREPDMIDIEATENSQRWQIADQLEKAARKP